jgi:hypothetical protein
MTQPLHHIVRVRTTDDLRNFVKPGLLDEVVVNANLLESAERTLTALLQETSLPYSVDPMLWRLQMPEWSKNAAGGVKRNYQRLAEYYSIGTGLTLGLSRLTDTVATNKQWQMIARNAIEYQQNRLRRDEGPPDLFGMKHLLEPVRLTSPALVALTKEEDAVNLTLANAAIEFAGRPIAIQVIIPVERMLEPAEVARVLESLPVEGVGSYSIWTPEVTEERLIGEEALFAAMVRVIATLTDKGIAVGHQHATYTVMALHDIGLSSITHPLNWVDHGGTFKSAGFANRSCRTYAPALRHAIKYDEAFELAGGFDVNEYREMYCDCIYCTGLYSKGLHPFDELLRTRVVQKGNRSVTEPTPAAVAANNWHFLLSRRSEVLAFSADPAIDVIARDIERATKLHRGGDAMRLGHLASMLKSA